MRSSSKLHTMTLAPMTRGCALKGTPSQGMRKPPRPLKLAQPGSMLVLMRSMLAAVPMIVRAFRAMQAIVGVIGAVIVLVRMSVLMGVGVAVGMRMHHLPMCVLMSVDMGMRMVVLMLVRMAVGLGVRVIVIAHLISPSIRPF